MDPILTSFATSLGANAVSKALAVTAEHLRMHRNTSRTALGEKLRMKVPGISREQARELARGIVQVLANDGLVSLEGGRVFAPNEIAYQAGPNGRIVLANGVVSQSRGTAVIIGEGASIDFGPGAGMIQT